MNEGSSGTTRCQLSGSLSSIGLAEFNIINASTTTIDNMICNNVNVIFVTGTLTVTGDIVKSTKNSSCLFVLANGASIIIKNIPSNDRPADSDGKGKPHLDRFEAGIVQNPVQLFQ